MAMTNIWRRQPSQKLRSADFVRKQTDSAATKIAEGFWEATTPPPAVGGFVQCNAVFS
jgi:hypothetical protein